MHSRGTKDGGVIPANEDGRITPDYAKPRRFLHPACRGGACELCGLNMPACIPQGSATGTPRSREQRSHLGLKRETAESLDKRS